LSETDSLSGKNDLFYPELCEAFSNRSSHGFVYGLIACWAIFFYQRGKEHLVLYQALYRKWRPRTFEDVVGQSHITETLKTQVDTGRLSHAYLFTGTRGTGKTTCAKILARAVNCEHPVNGNPCNCCAACKGIENGSVLDVLELDAASNNGVDHVRALRDEAVYSPAAVRKRVYIVDEVHMLSPAAFNALLKIMEEPPAHLMFILATTELHKVPATILSRCQRFSFKRIRPEDIAGRLSYVASQESIDLTDDGAALLARLSDGAMRDALSLLDQCAAGGGTVDQQSVLDTLGLAGNVQTAHLMNAVRKHDPAAALSLLGDLYAKGKDIKAVLDEMASLTRDLLVGETAPNSGTTLMTGGYDSETMKALTKGFPAPRLVRVLTILQDTLSRIKLSSNPRMEAELCLIRLCDETLDGSTDGLAARISRLEALMAAGVPVAPATAQTAPTPAAPNVDAGSPEDEVPPPFDYEPPPEADSWQPPIPAAPTSAPAPQPTPQQQSALQQADAALWEDISSQMKSELPPPASVYIASPRRVRGVVEGNQLVLYVNDVAGRKVLSNITVIQMAGNLASERLGRPITVRVAIDRDRVSGKTAAPKADPSTPEKNFNELLNQFQQLDGFADIK
jgi:DNA polymerase-3 subunit gamma/tau